MIEIPPALDAAWYTHGYHGSVSHNVKAIYQRYLGWYDGNPAHLWQHPPEAAATRYVQAIGGLDATIARAQAFADAGDLTSRTPPSRSSPPSLRMASSSRRRRDVRSPRDYGSS